MRGQSTIKSKLHHQRLSVRQLHLGVPVKRLRHKEVLAEDFFDDLKVLIGVVCLAVLLVVHVSIESVRRLVGTMDTKLTVEDASAISVVEAFLFFFCTLLEEHLS